MKAFKCPHCGGDVHYDVGKESVTCEFCGSTISRAEYQQFLDENNMLVSNELVCPQCGGTLLSYDDTIATFCNYCGSPVTFNKRIREETKPDGIIPFKVKKDAAAVKYREMVSKSLFAPDWMADPGQMHMTGIYMPFYSYSAKTSGSFKCPGTKKIEYPNKTIYEDYKVDFSLAAEYDGTRFDASASFPDSMSESIDDYNLNVVPFETSYTAGFYADGGNVDEEEYDGVVSTLVRGDLFSGQNVANGISLKTNNLNPEIEIDNKKFLLPVWLCTHKVGDRICYAAINGQTGKAAADIPIDKSKYWKTAIVATAIIATFLNLFFTLPIKALLIVSAIIAIMFSIFLSGLLTDIEIRKLGYDDIGRNGYDKFKKVARAGSSTGGMQSQKVGHLNWTFTAVKAAVHTGPLILLLVISIFMIIFKLPWDTLYYLIAVGYIIYAFVAAFRVIDKQNELASREIPVFTMKRGGDK